MALEVPNSDAGRGCSPLGARTPKVSVLMTTYNHERYIAQALDSVLGQRHGYDFELVVGDDASTDGTAAIVQAYARRYPGLIRLVDHPVNVGHCRNYLSVLEACRGEYVAILDGDDSWTDPHKLEQQVEFLDSHPAFVLSCHRFLRHFTRDDRVVPDLYPELYAQRPTGFVMDPERFFTHWVAQTSTVVLRRSAVRLEELRAFRHFGDVQLFYSVLKQGQGYAHGFFGALYNVHGEGIWSRLSEDQQFEFNLRILDELAARYPDDRPLRRARAVCRHRLLFADYQALRRAPGSPRALARRAWTAARLLLSRPEFVSLAAWLAARGGSRE